MYSRGCLHHQAARGSVVSQLLPQHTAAASSRRVGGLCCLHTISSSSSCIQQPWRSGSFPPLPPVPTRRLRQRQQWQQQQRQQHVARAAVEVWPSLDRRSKSKYVNQLNEDHGAAGFFEFYQSAVTGQPVLYLMHPRGHTVEVQLQGATITRWLKPDGEDLLHVRSDEDMRPGEPIGSGIPLAFPQWRDGLLPFNGFADKMEWQVAGTEFDGEFVNVDVPLEAWSSGAVSLAVDDDGRALAPQPLGVIDEADVRGDYEGLDEAALDKALDELDAANQAEARPPTIQKKPRGKLAAKAKLEAAAAAEAAAAQAAADEASAAAAAAAQAAAQAEQDTADIAAAEAAAAEGEESEEGGEDEFDDIEYGILEDPAPYVILQLSDTEETRAIWPHKFDLFYKITLMETDEFPDPKEGLPRGIFEGGNDTPLGPEDAALRELVHDEDEQISAAAALKLAERFRASNIRNGVGADGIYSEAEAEAQHPLPGQRTYTGMRFYTDEDGQINDEEGLEEAEEAAEAAKKAPRGAAAAASAKAKGRGQTKAAEELEEEEAAAAAEFEDDGDVEEGESGDMPLAPGVYTPEEPPMQIKMEWVLINKDPVGSAPLSFQLGALSHFKTEDQSKHGEFVRVLGLGGALVYDWSRDSRKPRLVGNSEDYVTFDGEVHDAVYVGTSEADVMFCPGSRTHFEIDAREGLPDHVVWHPGALGLPGLEVEPRFFAQVGAGRLALPKKLAPGEQWKGEVVIRHHERYWEAPIFDRDAAQPLPKLVTQRDDADDREDMDEGHIVEGVISSRLGGGAHVPSNDM